VKVLQEGSGGRSKERADAKFCRLLVVFARQRAPIASQLTSMLVVVKSSFSMLRWEEEEQERACEDRR
jgi:hypothetical protein